MLIVLCAAYPSAGGLCFAIWVLWSMGSAILNYEFGPLDPEIANQLAGLAKLHGQAAERDLERIRREDPLAYELAMANEKKEKRRRF